MDDHFSDSPDFLPDASFPEANKVIHSAFTSAYASQHAKNITIRRQLLESAIQKLLESRTFYISDVRDIAAMNNRPFDSRSKLYEQLNILNCREYRKMRSAVLELLPLMIHRATGIAEERFVPIVDANRAERTVTPPSVQSPSSMATPAGATDSAKAGLPAVTEAVDSAVFKDDARAPGGASDKATPGAATDASTRERPWPLILSIGLNLMMGIAVLVSLGQMRNAEPQAMMSMVPAFGNSNVLPAGLVSTAGAGAKPLLVDSVIHTATPAASLSQMAASLPQGTADRQYRVGVQIEQVGGK